MDNDTLIALISCASSVKCTGQNPQLLNPQKCPQKFLTVSTASAELSGVISMYMSC